MEKDEKSIIDLEKKIRLGCVSAILMENISKKLFGDILTVCDASSKDAESRKAVRSLVSQSFSRVLNKINRDLDNLTDEEEIKR